MNKKWNRKKWLPLGFVALSVESIYFWFFSWEYFAYKIPLKIIYDFDLFIFKTFHWSYATSNIIFYGPLIFSAIMLLLALYFRIMTVKEDYDNEDTDVLSITIDSVVYLFLFFVFAVFALFF